MSGPPFPEGMTRNEFGSRVMRWGTGYDAAVARKRTITVEWLIRHGVTREMIDAWLTFYEQVYDQNPANHSARGRTELMRYCLELLQEAR